MTYPDIVEVSETVLETYVGVYEVSPQFKITITRAGKQLFLQATGQSQFELYVAAQNEFFLKVVEANVHFNTAENGRVSSMFLHQGGQHIPAPKVK